MARQPSRTSKVTSSDSTTRTSARVSARVQDGADDDMVAVSKTANAKVQVTAKATTAVKRKAAPTKSLKEEEEDEDDIQEKKVSIKKAKVQVQVKVEEETTLANGDAKKPPAKKRKTTAKASNSDDAMPLAPRTAVATLKHAMHIGAHVSGAGGVHNAVANATEIGANAFALFLKSQRKWTSPPLADEARTQFTLLTKQHSYDAARHVLPHGSYLVNLAQQDKAKADQAYDNFVDDLRRCEALGIALYNFHPGSTGGAPMADATARIAAQLNRAHKETKTVVTLLENMCGSGNVVGSRFEDLADVIREVKDKSRVGVCLDTCHAFAAGYDLRDPKAFEKTMEEFDRVVGLKYLRALHLNDSKAPLSSHRDLHANIGTGFLGLRAFHNVVNFPPFAGLPMVLETPIDRPGPNGKSVEDRRVWADEIKLLEGLVDADPETEEFKATAAKLWEQGAAERARVQGQVDKKAEKDAKKTEKARVKGATGGKGKKKRKKDDEDEDDEDGGDSCCSH